MKHFDVINIRAHLLIGKSLPRSWLCAMKKLAIAFHV